MGVINLLERHVAELIAAGEVVERPSSVVKELMENAIDAGATSLDIEIKNGGISFIRVTDNGCGIAGEDVATAFLRHATSKVRSQDDLESIETLGFRGEALASVAAVSLVEMLTCVEGELAGTRYVIEGGEEVLSEDAGCPLGTTVIVRNLFYNTPARLKFLKKDFTEANFIASTIDRIALSHPEVSVRFIRDGKVQMQTPGNGRLLSAIYAVLGSDFADGLVEAGDEFGGVKVWGYVCKPSASRANRNMQFFFVNGRLVKSGTCSAALEQAFRGSIMAGRFPSCVLHISLPAHAVDCNIHPAKVEVRFINEDTVFRALYNAAKSALMKDSAPLEMAMPERGQDPGEIFEEIGQVEQIRLKSAAVEDDKKDEGGGERAAGVLFDSFVLYDAGVKADNAGVGTRSYTDIDIEAEDKASEAEVLEDGSDETEEFFEEEPKILGEAFGTYIIVEKAHELVFIDKHAAHERLIYERLLEGQGKGATQVLLSPVTVVLEKTEYNAVLENLPLLSDAGFDIEDFGTGAVLVRSAPIFAEGEDISAVISEIAGKLLLNDKEIRTEKLKWIFHSVACRAAIKAGDKSSDSELYHLYIELSKNPLLRHCPHGRPVAVRISKGNIEKQFGRI